MYKIKQIIINWRTIQSMQNGSKKTVGYNKKNFCNTTWNKYIRKQQYLKFRYCFVYYVLAIKCKVKFPVAQNKLLPKISLNLQKNAN